MEKPFLTVVETQAYLADAKKILTKDERAAVVDTIAADPTSGDLIVGSGGVRKLRVGVASKGKRGGARVIYYFHSLGHPAILLMIYPKSARTDLSPDQLAALAAFTKAMKQIWR